MSSSGRGIRPGGYVPVKAGTCAGTAMLLAPAVRITTAALSPEEAERLAADLAAVLRPAGRTRAA